NYISAGLTPMVQNPDSTILLGWNDQGKTSIYERLGFIKLDKTGNPIWGRKYNFPSRLGDSYMVSFAKAADGGLVGVGQTFTNPSGLMWRFILKTDSSGNIQWCKQYFPDSASSYNADGAERITATSDTGYLFSFAALDSNTSNWYTYLMKLNSNGNLVWAKRYTSLNIGGPLFTKPQLVHNNIQLCLSSNFTIFQAIKLDILGVPIWSYEYTSPDLQYTYDGICDSSNNMYLSGETIDTLGFIYKIDTSGNILWSYKYGIPDSTTLSNLLLTIDGGLLGYGWIWYEPYDTNHLQNMTSFVKVDQWGQDGCEQPFTITRSPLPLTWQNTGVKVYPVAMTQLDTILNFHDAPMDTTTLCAVRNVTSVKTIATTGNNIEVYPNPNNGEFTLALTNVSEKCNLEIYNVLGQKVTVATLNPPAGGQGDNLIDLSSQPNGMYLYRVIANNSELLGSGKFVISK
ncbi:MAG TPA: T9SS type A sorting domain-containing protein, partial [Bacteroidia bacterium]|nr:T9SS type A sorting domain-containing protein [Bacteroidia bacterium]